jgi:hypothetical protein
MVTDLPGDEPKGTEGTPPELDALTEAQKRLDDLSVMFYTYIGILQRDAPPSSRAPDEMDELPADKAVRAELRTKIPEYVSDIVRTSREINTSAQRIADEYEADAGEERSVLAEADADSMSAGTELSTAGKDLTRLLHRVRGAIYETEHDG